MFGILANSEVLGQHFSSERENEIALISITIAMKLALEYEAYIREQEISCVPFRLIGTVL